MLKKESQCTTKREIAKEVYRLCAGGRHSRVLHLRSEASNPRRGVSADFFPYLPPLDFSAIWRLAIFQPATRPVHIAHLGELCVTDQPVLSGGEEGGVIPLKRQKLFYYCFLILSHFAFSITTAVGAGQPGVVSQCLLLPLLICNYDQA